MLLAFCILVLVADILGIVRTRSDADRRCRSRDLHAVCTHRLMIRKYQETSDPAGCIIRSRSLCALHHPVEAVESAVSSRNYILWNHVRCE
ncbi:hypothetical protein HDK77DRAFT_445629 [Phyllosticta capitalensis]